MTTREEPEHVGYPYQGRYAGDVIRFDLPPAKRPAGRGRYDAVPESVHKQGSTIGTHPADQPVTTEEYLPSSRRRPPVQTGSDGEEQYDDQWPPRSPSSSIRYSTTPKRTAQFEAKPTRVIRSRRGIDRGRLLIWLGSGMLVMLLGFVALNWVSTWWATQTDDWSYGRPRTFQIDAVVGHHDSPAHPSHFIALNLHRQVIVIELPGGDPTHALTYVGPTLVGDGQDLAPVTLSFDDRTADGKPDLDIHIGDQVVVMLNQDGKFVFPKQS